MPNPTMKRDNCIAALHLLGFKPDPEQGKGLIGQFGRRKLRVLLSRKDITVRVEYGTYQMWGAGQESVHTKKFKHDFKAAIDWLIEYKQKQETIHDATTT